MANRDTASLWVGIAAWVLTLPPILIGIFASWITFVGLLANGAFYGSLLSASLAGIIGLCGLFHSFRATSGKSYNAVSRRVAYLMVGTLFSLVLSVWSFLPAGRSGAIADLLAGPPWLSWVGFGLLAVHGVDQLGRMCTDARANHPGSDAMASESALLAVALTLVLLLIGFTDIP